MTDALKQEREAFEAWWDEDDDIPNDGPWNPDAPIQFAWSAWQARAALAAPQAGPVGEAVHAWRNLAHQFDAQRMAAMAHLQMMVADPAKHVNQARAFLAAAPQPAAPQAQQPYLYVYEYDSPFGLHREFYPREYNGMKPTRTVALYTAPQPAAPAQVGTVELLRNALEHAKNGLLWYQERYPEATDGSDDEAMEMIDTALAAAPQPAASQAWLATRLWNERETWMCPADIERLLAAPHPAPRPRSRAMLERDIEKHLVERVKQLGGEVRKVQWVGRRNAPDRLVMLPLAWDVDTPIVRSCWVELKNPDTIKTFPANAHERAQAREHERMRKMGQRVEVIGTIEQVERLLS